MAEDLENAGSKEAWSHQNLWRHIDGHLTTSTEEDDDRLHAMYHEAHVENPPGQHKHTIKHLANNVFLSQIA